MSAKYNIKGNWKPFARFYMNALSDYLDAMNICDNDEVREEMDEIYTLMAELGEKLDKANS